MTILAIQENNRADEITNISLTTLETNAEILLAIPSASNTILSDNDMPVRKVYLQYRKLSADTWEKFNSLIHDTRSIFSKNRTKYYSKPQAFAKVTYHGFSNEIKVNKCYHQKHSLNIHKVTPWSPIGL